MTGTRWMLPALAALVVVAPADAGSIFGRKPKTDAQVKRLIDALRTETDDKKKRATIAELRDTDPRTHPEVIAVLVGALQRDTSPQVRVDAAEAIGQFKIVFGLAGLALEGAAEADPSRYVRDSARQALWEYHLIGYRSARGADGIAGQTSEPPVAKPAAARPLAELAPVAAVEPAVAPPTGPIRPIPQVAPVAPPALPARVVAVEPARPPGETRAGGLRVLLTVAPPPQLNVTAEPLAARPRKLPLAPYPRPAGAAADDPDSLSAARVVAAVPDAVYDPADLPPVSLPPTSVLPGRHPAHAALPGNEYGPRVAPPTAHHVPPAGLHRFMSPE